MRKILLLSAGYGEGHNAAARGLHTAFGHVAPGEIDAQFHDVFETTYGEMHQRARRAYIGIINKAPRIWAAIYTLLDRTPLLALSMPLSGKLIRAVRDLIEREKPVAVVSVYPVYGLIITKLWPDEKTRPFAFHTIVTDSITVNRVWHRGVACSSYIVPNEDTARAMIASGVPPEKLKTLGFPVQPRFALDRQPRPGPEIPRVLYMVNSRPDLAPETVRRILAIEPLTLTVTAGRDEVLRAELDAIAKESGGRLTVYGWTDQMPNLLMTHHLLIGKAGGATVQETIAAATPMLLTGIVPGQEEGNARLLLENKCGALATTPVALAEAVANAFADSARVWRSWEANISKLSRPDAALTIARYILDPLT